MRLFLIFVVLHAVAMTAGCGPSSESKYNEALVRYNAEQVALENLRNEKQTLFEAMTNDEQYRSKQRAMVDVEYKIKKHTDAVPPEKAPKELLAQLKIAQTKFEEVAKPFRERFTVLNRKISQQEERIKLAEQERNEAEALMRPR